MSTYVWQEKASRRTRHLRKASERAAGETSAEVLAKMVDAGIEPPPFEVIRENHEERIAVPTGCTGILIGKKGSNLKLIEKRHKVTIRIEDNHVVIHGASDRVSAARDELDFHCDTIEIPPKMAGWVCGKGGRHLKLIREMTGVAVLNLCAEDDAKGTPQREGSGTAAGADAPHASRCWFELKGRRETVDDARVCLETHMSYYPVFVEMEAVEQEAGKKAWAGRRPVLNASKGGASSGKANDGKANRGKAGDSIDRSATAASGGDQRAGDRRQA